jgi:hypothetical protein
MAAALAAQQLEAPLLDEAFPYSDGVITNEWAYWNPASPSARRSPVWELTSGSLFALNGRGWTGVPDDRNPNADSSATTGSAVFRATTQASDFLNAVVTFRLLNRGLVTTGTTPAVAWDGCHIFLRYQSQYSLYYASINRRDNTVVIKKKVPGGPSNGGTYYNISPSARYVVPYNVWQDIKATIATNENGSVTIALYANGQLLLTTTDNGAVGGPPIRSAGRLGIRGDNADLMFDDFRVMGTRGVNSTPGSVADSEARAPQKFLSPALADGVNDAALFGPGAQHVSIYTLRGRRVFDAERGGSLLWNGRDELGRVVESGVYIARIRKTDGTYCFQSFAVAQ